jgi:cell division septal protein FtsQ
MSAGDEEKRRARVIRNALLLALAAILVYGVFIFMQYQRSKGTM